MALVLSRKESEVLNFDEELFIEIDKEMKNGELSNKLRVYVYDKLNDEEYVKYLCLEEFITIKWKNNRKKIKLKIIDNNRGRKQFKILIEADKEIGIGRIKYIPYKHSVERFDDSEYDEYDNYEEETDYQIKYKDELVNKYKDELSWFYN